MAGRAGVLPLLGFALLAVAVTGVHIVYDETSWTKQHWEKQKIDSIIWEHLNPSDEALKGSSALELIKTTASNSLDGPMPRRAAAKAANPSSPPAWAVR